MLGCWVRFGNSMEDKVKVLREDGGEGGLISVERMEGEREREQRQRRK